MKRVVEREGAAASFRKQVRKTSEVVAHEADPGFSRDVIDWQKRHGRHALPWQNTRDAYRVWLSEIMLQQTQVSAVIPYYLRFLETFPTVQSLAAALPEQVMALWSGLGYYSRARNLHKCAQTVVAEYGGVFPHDPALLEQLPGIGRSTAAAIAAFSYGARAAILDGNVKRVFARVFGIDRFPGEKAVENDLWQRAAVLLPEQDIESYTQGLMDLGATLCTRSSPACQRCPLAHRCVAFATGRTAELPVRKPKQKVPEKETAMLVICHQDRVLLEQRPDSGIWGGLLSLPEVPADENGIDADRAVARFGTAAQMQKLAPFSHVFTHFKLHVSPWRIDLAQRLLVVAEGEHVWLPVDDVQNAPLPAPVKKLLLAVFAAEPDLLS
ncbi:A/G-specific adenine glycosylase [Oxalicibacterium solurbis]|uniref:Adenine DNA glycosylase n=1 Tax=Oxalicibacterium solurbis TaxID=69280 RepID=A0A8J3F5P3_9BURK|nr:A/G-specific adenine glycosylase [Oxalicibacterium solurbis]GGI53731.1 A/G-specific adenine glycosylase [Oxalicibacterium solurbis]